MRPNLILSLRQRADHALFLGDRALGRAPKVTEGERVRVKAHARWPGLVDDEYTIAEVVGKDENAMCKLRGRTGRYVKWFRAATDLEPAQPTEVPMNSNIEQKAAAFAARVTALSNGRTHREAMSLAQMQDAEGAEAWRLAGGGGRRMEAAPAPTSINLSVREGETFDALAMRYANEHGVSLRQAVHEVGKARPDLAAARG